MNFWIESARDSLVATMRSVDAVLLNDAELRLLTQEVNLARAARIVQEWGVSFVVVKRGEYGAALFSLEGFFALPGYPLESVADPTGAGDSFAGGFLGYLSAQGPEARAEAAIRRAMTYGSVMASFNVEAFGTERMQCLTHKEISQRFADFRRMTHFEPAPEESFHLRV
jgi:sugar/nucleoside kinase (ribokinase family)